MSIKDVINERIKDLRKEIAFLEGSAERAEEFENLPEDLSTAINKLINVEGPSDLTEALLTLASWVSRLSSEKIDASDLDTLRGVVLMNNQQLAERIAMLESQLSTMNAKLAGQRDRMTFLENQS